MRIALLSLLFLFTLPTFAAESRAQSVQGTGTIHFVGELEGISYWSLITDREGQLYRVDLPKKFQREGLWVSYIGTARSQLGIPLPPTLRIKSIKKLVNHFSGLSGIDPHANG